MSRIKTWEYVGFFLISWVARVLFSVLFATCRVQIVGQEIEKKYLKENKGKGLIYASWHQGLFYLVHFYRSLKFIVMISLSKDGDLAAQLARRLGWIPIRGSSSKRGSEALKEMEQLLLAGHRGGLVVDAPRGPPYKSKIGIIVLAQRTGLPIIPVVWNAQRNWRLRNWDRTMIPKPFSRIVFWYADSFIEVPAQASHEECEVLRQKLDDTLVRLMDQAETFFQEPVVNEPHRNVVSPQSSPGNSRDDKMIDKNENFR